ncbi:MAG: cell division protein ZapA [Acidiphilium sp. 37-64-53]|uniref:cell division protein ZapA n=1 Tax=Acidiphilium TaxID=522 RepID=UPI000BD22D62|nr:MULTISPECIES: cell division protein ZapA [Acidiphilium]OYW02760.1 MAG: cell division protein ZapA [Acidiphilium sp. 37-64-53]OZB29174.1 MAG: cell division protein ZapA [Acidiphilium sp. 34-64-41]HQT84727.1 cell division protein ZapA [Acidiphilium rubrum]
MAQVTIRINGYSYAVTCEDGQEPRLTEMASEIDRRISSIKAIGGQSGESRLLVLAALLLADELHDTKAALDMAKASKPAKPASPEHNARLRRIAARAEEIAADLAES